MSYVRSSKGRASKRRGKSSRRAKLYKVVPGYTQVNSAYKFAGHTAEKKYIDNALVLTTATAGVVTGTYVTMVQGQTASTRIGNKIRVKNINLSLTFDTSGADLTPDPLLMRCMLLWDKQANGALPAVLDILQTASVYSYRNMETVERFTVLKDKFILLKTPTALTGAWAASAADGRFAKFAWKGAMDVHYGGNAGTVADLRSENLVILLISNIAAGHANGNIRVKYTDM